MFNQLLFYLLQLLPTDPPQNLIQLLEYSPSFTSVEIFVLLYLYFFIQSAPYNQAFLNHSNLTGSGQNFAYESLKIRKMIIKRQILISKAQTVGPVLQSILPYF